MPAPMIPLFEIQRSILGDESERIGVLCCRGLGKTFAVMLKLVMECYEADVAHRARSWFVFAASAGATEEYIRCARLHVDAIGIAAACHLGVEEHELEDGRKMTMSKIEWEHGSRIVALPTNPFTMRGRHGSLLWGETGFTPNDVLVWRAAAPIANAVGDKIILESTAGAKRGPFYEKISSGKAGGWSIHFADIYEAIRQGAPLSVEKAIADFGRGRAFATEFLCLFEDEGSRFLDLDTIAACEDPNTLVVPYLRVDAERSGWRGHLDADETERKPSEGFDKPEAWARLFAPLAGFPREQLTLGFDVGRSRHLSSLWVNQRDGLIDRTRCVIELANRRYTEQEAALWAALAYCRRACIDKGLIGNQLAERTVERFGEHRVEGVQFNDAIKEHLAMRVGKAFEDFAIRTPPVGAVRDSLHSVYKMTTAANKVRFDAKATDETGHADAFWACGLALEAAGDASGLVPPSAIVRGVPPAWSRSRMIP